LGRCTLVEGVWLQIAGQTLWQLIIGGGHVEIRRAFVHAYILSAIICANKVCFPSKSGNVFVHWHTPDGGAVAATPAEG
jgi:hypothetical protein